MSQAESVLLRHIDERLTHMFEFPELWGGSEALELQALQLLESHAIVRNPAADRTQLFSELQRSYRRFVSQLEPRDNRLLSHRVGVDMLWLVKRLAEFRRIWEDSVKDPNPYDHHDVVLTIEFDRTVTLPPTSMIGHYYETFRRVVRGIARPNTVGRTPRELELATEFVTPELKIHPKNGAPGRVVLPLELPPETQQLLSFASPLAAVREAMSNIATIVEWANSGEDASRMAETFTVPERRQRVASQTLRLIPGPASSCELVEIGGRAMGRPRPVQLRAGLASRLNDVVRFGATTEHYELEGVVRKLDLDRGLIGVRPDAGGRRIDLWSSADIEIDSRLLDARVKLVGERYQDSLGKVIHFATSVDVLSFAEDELENDAATLTTLRLPE